MKTDVPPRRPAVPPLADMVLRSATALLMTLAAALVLVHAQIYCGGLPQQTASVSSSAAATTADPR